MSSFFGVVLSCVGSGLATDDS